MQRLREAGYTTREEPFTFSSFPGRLATPLLGAFGALIVGLTGRAALAGMRWTPLAIVLAGAGVGIVTTTWLMRRGILVAPLMRSMGVNLVATRGDAKPAVWLSAHLDSKSQPVPTLVRTTGIALMAIGFTLTLALAAAVAWAVTVQPVFWMGAASLTLIGAVPVVSSMVGSRSPGALDNASGVVTVLGAAAQLGNDAGVGVLITDAEELGLAGARHWAARSNASVVLNVDGIDDAGELRAVWSGRRPAALMDAVDRAVTRTGVACRKARLAFGLLTDSVAFADAGIASVTLMRGTLLSLARVHGRRDDLAHMSGAGIVEASRFLAGLAREVAQSGTSTSETTRWQ